jgi:hypothetical protein
VLSVEFQTSRSELCAWSTGFCAQNTGEVNVSSSELEVSSSELATPGFKVEAPSLTAFLNRVSHSLVKEGIGCRVSGVVNANENGCKREL